MADTDNNNMAGKGSWNSPQSLGFSLVRRHQNALVPQNGELRRNHLGQKRISLAASIYRRYNRHRASALYNRDFPLINFFSRQVRETPLTEAGTGNEQAYPSSRDRDNITINRTVSEPTNAAAVSASVSTVRHSAGPVSGADLMQTYVKNKNSGEQSRVIGNSSNALHKPQTPLELPVQRKNRTSATIAAHENPPAGRIQAGSGPVFAPISVSSAIVDRNSGTGINRLIEKVTAPSTIIGFSADLPKASYQGVGYSTRITRRMAGKQNPVSVISALPAAVAVRETITSESSYSATATMPRADSRLNSVLIESHAVAAADRHVSPNTIANAAESIGNQSQTGHSSIQRAATGPRAGGPALPLTSIAKLEGQPKIPNSIAPAPIVEGSGGNNNYAAETVSAKATAAAQIMSADFGAVSAIKSAHLRQQDMVFDTPYSPPIAMQRALQRKHNALPAMKQVQYGYIVYPKNIVSVPVQRTTAQPGNSKTTAAIATPLAKLVSPSSNHFAEYTEKVGSTPAPATSFTVIYRNLAPTTAEFNQEFPHIHHRLSELAIGKLETGRGSRISAFAQRASAVMHPNQSVSSSVQRVIGRSVSASHPTGKEINDWQIPAGKVLGYGNMFSIPAQRKLPPPVISKEMAVAETPVPKTVVPAGQRFFENTTQAIPDTPLFGFKKCSDPGSSLQLKATAQPYQIWSDKISAGTSGIFSASTQQAVNRQTNQFNMTTSEAGKNTNARVADSDMRRTFEPSFSTVNNGNSMRLSRTQASSFSGTLPTATKHVSSFSLLPLTQIGNHRPTIHSALAANIINRTNKLSINSNSNSNSKASRLMNPALSEPAKMLFNTPALTYSRHQPSVIDRMANFSADSLGTGLVEASLTVLPMTADSTSQNEEAKYTIRRAVTRNGEALRYGNTAKPVEAAEPNRLILSPQVNSLAAGKENRLPTSIAPGQIGQSATFYSEQAKNRVLPLPFVQPLILQRQTGAMADDVAAHDGTDHLYRQNSSSPVLPATNNALAQAGENTISKTDNADSQASSADDLFDKVWRKLMRKLASEHERIGGSRRWAS